jgi:hypothetical protein
LNTQLTVMSARQVDGRQPARAAGHAALTGLHHLVQAGRGGDAGADVDELGDPALGGEEPADPVLLQVLSAQVPADCWQTGGIPHGDETRGPGEAEPAGSHLQAITSLRALAAPG